MTKAHSLSTAARTLLTTAGGRDDRVALPPERLPAAAQRAVVHSLLKAGLLEEVAADDDQGGWRTTEQGERLALRITQAGLRAVGADTAENPPEAAQSGPHAPTMATTAPHAPAPVEAAQDSPASPQAGTRLTLRAAAQAILDAWDEEGRPTLPDTIAALRAALLIPHERSPARTTSGAAHAPRTDTKQANVLALLRRPEGASGPQMIEATGWAPHTVRGFLAGLAKKGITVTVLERVRQVGPVDRRGIGTPLAG